MIYKFVSIGNDTDYSNILSKQTKSNIDFAFHSDPPETTFKGFKGFLYRLHNSQRISPYFKLPLRKLWAKHIVSNEILKKFQTSDKICFIFSGKGYLYKDNGLYDYLRRTYPNSKLIYIFSDTVKLYTSRNDFSFDDVRKDFDLIFTYNAVDAEKYNLILTPGMVKDFSWVEDDPDILESDLFFVGKDKGRFNDLIAIYEECQKRGLRCDFHIVDVPKEKQKYEDSIIYNQRITYNEVLKRSKKTKCIVNIIQEGASGITLRDYEAIGMNKCLLTNNDALLKSSFYTPDKVIWFDNFNEELSKINEANDVSWNGSEEHSVQVYYKWLEKQLV
jgi:hypothetical protein